MSGERRRLAADALLEVAVAGEDEDVVVEEALADGRLRVEQPALATGRHRHPDRVADALAERAGGGLDAGGVAVLGVAGRQAAPGAQRLEVVELEAVTGEVELDVEGEAGVAAGQHEPVAARPVRVGGVVAHQLLEDQVRRRGQAHRRARVAVADLLHGVHGQHPDGVDGEVVDLGPVQLGVVVDGVLVTACCPSSGGKHRDGTGTGEHAPTRRVRWRLRVEPTARAIGVRKVVRHLFLTPSGPFTTRSAPFPRPRPSGIRLTASGEASEHGRAAVGRGAVRIDPRCS